MKTRGLALALSLLLFLTGCSYPLEPAQERTTGERIGKMYSEHTVGQTFVTQHDGLRAMDVLLRAAIDGHGKYGRIASLGDETHHPDPLLQ